MRRWRGRPAGDNRRGEHRDSAPCTSGPGGSCVFFDFDDVIPTIRTFTVNLPGSGPGTVEFTFHGSLYCTNTGTVADKGDRSGEPDRQRQCRGDPHWTGGTATRGGAQGY